MNNVVSLTKMSINNFLSLKKSSIIILICFSVAASVNIGFAVMLIAMITYLFAYQTMAYEDSYGINYLISYLPVTKKEYVLSRYLFNIIMMAVASLWYGVIYLISTKFNLIDFSVFSFKMIVEAGIVSSVILISILIPLLLKLGIVKGRMAMTVIYVAVIISVITFGQSASPEVFRVLDKFAFINGDVAVVVFSVVCMLISYFVSNKIYNNKELLN